MADVQVIDAELPLDAADDVLLDKCRPVLRRVRPQWNEGQLCFEIFSGGITNKIFAVWSASSPDDKIVFRVFGRGTELFINRQKELTNWKLLAQVGCAAPIYCQFTNGLACGFLPGEPVTVEQVRQPNVYRALIKTLTVMHAMPIPDTISREPELWNKFDSFMAILPTHFEDVHKQKRFSTEYPSKANIMHEIAKCRAIADEIASPLVFCHNDLLMKNILYDAHTASVHLIDYEYGAVNYQAYDIANHYNEFVDMEVIPEQYPSEEFQLNWLREYVREWHRHTGAPGSEPSADDVRRLYSQVDRFAPVPHLFWSVWSMIQAANSTIDFDFVDYAIKRYNEYVRMSNRTL